MQNHDHKIYLIDTSQVQPKERIKVPPSKKLQAILNFLGLTIAILAVLFIVCALVFHEFNTVIWTVLITIIFMVVGVVIGEIARDS